MRPSILTPLFASAINLEGVGPKVLDLLKKALRLSQESGEPRVLDILKHCPTGIVDRSYRPQLKDATPGAIATLQIRVVKHNAPPRSSRAPYRVICEDETGKITLVFFRANGRYLMSQLPPGELRVISGRVERYGENLQMSHPDYIIPLDEMDRMPLIEPIYPMTAGLSTKILFNAVRQSLSRLPELDEWQDAAWLKQQDWAGFADAMQKVHKPESAADLSLSGPVRRRLAYDELLANQLALALVRESTKGQPGRSIKGNGELSAKILKALPFTLTNSQQQAVADIKDDMASDGRMLRLLQGDVGSGKTVVALMAMAIANEAGMQTTLMAPTEVLARQHWESITPLAEAAGLTTALLTGRDKGKPRKEILAKLEQGEIDILIGTHAVFQADVTYKDLGFIVIDEQHRFGVHQRLALQDKGGPRGVETLVMTATPIPRTLLMTHYGDLEVSKLLEKPAGRKPIITRAVALDRLEEILQGLRRAIEQGSQIYWVCPLVEESEVLRITPAEERYSHLKQYLGDKVALIHGKMKGTEKDDIMRTFAKGETSVLVATTVIEVGVDVPNASIIVIEHAERFGLSQLHQLRGRVGRGDRQSSCILLFSTPISETAKSRLDIMRQTDDGFLIAEEDLRLRGGGEILGARQSGEANFNLAEIPDFKMLLEAAHDDAQLILAKDPTLKSKRGKALRNLLYLFDRDEAIHLFRAG